VTSFFLGLIIWLGLASVGRKFWVHHKYIEKLIQLFEYGRKRVEKVNSQVKQRQRKLSKIHESYEEEDEEEDNDESDFFDEKNGNKNELINRP